MEHWQAHIIPIQWIAGSLLLFSLLLVFIIFLTKSYIKRIKVEEKKKAAIQLKHSEELIKNSIEIQEKERSRIASEVHDELISQLYQLKLLNQDEKMGSRLSTSIKTARRISHDLTPPLIDQCSLGELFQSFLFPYQKNHTLDIHTVDHQKMQLLNADKLNIYRIFQEVITNIHKHAQSPSIFVRLRVSSSRVLLIVKDSGIGISENKLNGLGSKNIELRAKQLNAQYTYTKNIPAGTIFTLCYETNK